MKSLIKKILAEEIQLKLNESQEYLDSLLDKISQSGMSSLTPKEQEDLKKLSQGQDIDYDEPVEEPFEEPSEEEIDLNKLFMHYAMTHEELEVDGKIYHAQIVEEMGDEHIEVTGPDVDFICSPFYEGHEGIAIQTVQGQALMLKVQEQPQTDKEMMSFVQKFYEKYLPKMIRKVSSLEGLN